MARIAALLPAEYLPPAGEAVAAAAVAGSRGAGVAGAPDRAVVRGAAPRSG